MAKPEKDRKQKQEQRRRTTTIARTPRIVTN